MNKILLSLALALMASGVGAQDFDLTKPQPIYDQSTGYGYDLQPAPDKKHPSAPFYFSVKVPDGNYRVKVVLGGRKNSNTTVRAEGRRLMVEAVTTQKAKEMKEVEFIVNKRSPSIAAGKQVKIKEREKDYLTWDEKLTLEFKRPAAGRAQHPYRARRRCAHRLSLRQQHGGRSVL